MNKRKLLKKLLASPANARFADVRGLAEAFGFRLIRVTGSHHIFARPRVPELVNLQEVSGEAKPYQVRQFLSLVELHNLTDVGGKRMKDYHINIFASEEDGGYIADIPDLAHCSAFGATPQEALSEVLKAKEAWLDAARTEGKPVPAPAFRPVIYQVAWGGV